uniref:Small ribosomal subunit biogenesis GTPase RsgA n=1 Tax=Roseihalotalea indica TaxID=2867963 RepID=A0AA49GUR8_9BACT|nr:ribosome small subunit-dependent GTPase A [Tunicatimonas sp. TK19036]
MNGLVMKSTGSWYSVLADDQQVYPSRLRGKFKIKGLKVTNPVAVGDRVVLEEEDEAENTAVITDILPRENYIIRKSTRKAHHGHILAANIDQAILIATQVFPRTSLGFIDRFLVSAESFRIPAVLVFNKTDLLDEDQLELQAALMDLYERVGYTCLAISAMNPDDIARLSEHLDHKVSLFSGHSGVGKSTILNQVHSDIDQKTSEVSTFANKGVHTTTYAEMFQISEESFVIDSPGIKELGLMDIQEGELKDYFPEMRALLGECKFYDCTHTHEPGCAVRAAVDEGEISESRYYNYLSMLEDEDSHR